MQPQSIFESLGGALRRARAARHWTQAMVGERVGRPRVRITELESDLVNARLGKDRLTLLADLCAALSLRPVLVPLDRLQAVLSILDAEPAPVSRPVPSAFSELFIDLSDDDEEDA